MGKRSLILFVLLFLFWIVISGSMSRQHLLAGAFLALITVGFWHDLGPRLPSMFSLGELMRLGRCLLFLVVYIIQANLSVAKTLLFSQPRVSPVFVMMRPALQSNWGRILLATSITLTPGTVTIDVHPETGQFIVHALTEEAAISLFYWQMIAKIRDLETYRRRRGKDVVDTGGIDDSNSSGAFEGHYGADSH